MNIREIYECINNKAPFSLQCGWDNSGLLVCDNENKQVKKILVCTDITREIALEAIEKNVELVISHHPVIFKGLKNLVPQNPAVILSNAKISAICCHTNADRGDFSLNHVVAQLLNLKVIEGVPLGFDDGDSFGIICETEKEIAPRELGEKIKNVLGCDYVRFTPSKKISRVGICTGSGGDFIYDAMSAGCDGLITGDVKHNFFVDARNLGFTIFDAGHYFTERIFKQWLMEILNDTEVEFLTPSAEQPPFSTI